MSVPILGTIRQTKINPVGKFGAEKIVERCIVEIQISNNPDLTVASDVIECRVAIDADLNPPLAALQRVALLRAREILDEQIRYLGSIVSR